MAGSLTVDELVAQLYLAAADGQQEQWEKSLRAVGTFAGASVAACYVRNAVTNALEETTVMGLAARDVDAYKARYAALDPAYQVLLGLEQGRMQSMHRYLDAQAVDRSEYFQDFYIPAGMRYSCGGSIVLGEHRTILAVHRPPGHSPYGADIERDLSRVLSHLPNILHIRRTTLALRLERSINERALAHLGQGALLVDAGGQVLFANAAAEQMLRTGALRVKWGKLECTSDSLQRQVERRVQNVCRQIPLPCADALRVIDHAGRPAAELRIVPFAEGTALLLLRALQREAPQRIEWDEQAERPYGLSRQELRLVQRLCDGVTPAAYAEEHSVKISTVRTQIRSILQKTGTERTAEVIGLFLRG